MLPDDDAVRDLTCTLLDLAVGMHATHVEQATAKRGPECVHSSIDIRGAWDGTVRLSLCSNLARRAAETMFETEETSADDVADCVRELANVLGGNLKALLPGPSQLSLPRIEVRAEATDSDPSASKTLHFHCDHGDLAVSIERFDARREAA